MGSRGEPGARPPPHRAEGRRSKSRVFQGSQGRAGRDPGTQRQESDDAGKLLRFDRVQRVIAAQHGWLDYEKCLLESLVCLRRAGADVIFTYGALDAARLIADQ